MLDRDEDGTISREEIEGLLESLGQQATIEEIDLLLGEVSGEVHVLICGGNLVQVLISARDARCTC